MEKDKPKISSTTIIKLEFKGQVFELTPKEAEELRKLIDSVLPRSDFNFDLEKIFKEKNKEVSPSWPTIDPYLPPRYPTIPDPYPGIIPHWQNPVYCGIETDNDNFHMKS